MVPQLISDGNAGSSATQLAGVGITIAVALASGAATGFGLRCLEDGSLLGGDDRGHWEVADDYDKGGSTWGV